MGKSSDRAKGRADVAPFHLHNYGRLSSTNDHAAELRRRGKLFAPSVVVTSRQTAGRGRGNNVWWSDASCLTATFAIAVDDAHPAGELPLIAGLAVRDAAAELTANTNIELKWPNDVLYDGRKLSGLLCERVNKLDLIGIGMNINLDPMDAPLPLQKTLTSLMMIAGKSIDRKDALRVVASHLWQNIQKRRKQPFSHFLREYERHHALLGKKVSVPGDPSSDAVVGRVEGVDSHGRLLVREGNKLHHVVAGHVTML